MTLAKFQDNASQNLLIRRACAKKAREQREVNNRDNLLVIESDSYDLEDNEAAEIVLNKIIQNAQKLNFNKNSQRYTRNSDRTR
ncbi:36935_t:CDS:2 [Gigaspora margarita]|uniref:36935_t:CDS:1 n=1 Tax=Gigaspora margarita TaxID=4874 RepID=A0ABN7VSZ6_GIGMA|nr:36935_t:CDS:2 [Gigaspora margarita]